jgi:hypothetical protein
VRNHFVCIRVIEVSGGDSDSFKQRG